MDACLWKAEATSGSLAAAQSGNCLEFEEKGHGAGLAKRDQNVLLPSPVLLVGLCPSLHLPVLVSLTPTLLSPFTFSLHSRAGVWPGQDVIN